MVQYLVLWKPLVLFLSVMKMYLLKRAIGKHDWHLLRVTMIKIPLITIGGLVDLHLNAHYLYIVTFIQCVFSYVRVIVFCHQTNISVNHERSFCVSSLAPISGQSCTLLHSFPSTHSSQIYVPFFMHINAVVFIMDPAHMKFVLSLI